MGLGIHNECIGSGNGAGKRKGLVRGLRSSLGELNYLGLITFETSRITNTVRFTVGFGKTPFSMK